jgi:hypothetical protein
MLASMLGDPMQRLVMDPKHSQHPGKSLLSYRLSPLFFFYLNDEFFSLRLDPIQVFVILLLVVINKIHPFGAVSSFLLKENNGAKE